MRNKDLDLKKHAPAEGKSAGNRLRLLDFDDLFLLKHLLEGHTVAATAKQLGLTQPAITQRVRKIERVFAEPMLAKVGRHVKLTKEGRAICIKAADALALMHEVSTHAQDTAVTIGASPSVGQRWLWPALSALRHVSPQLAFHLLVGSGDELVGLLDAGAIDACLTSAPAPLGSYGSLDVGEDDYVFVATPDLAARILTPEDLRPQTLLELDRSFSLLARIEVEARASVRFDSVWFLGTLSNVAAATLSGFGVAILPRSLVQAQIGAERLALVLPTLDLTPERFRLVFRRDRGVEPLVRQLIERLREKGLGEG